MEHLKYTKLRAPLAGVCFVGCPWVGWMVWVLPLLLVRLVFAGFAAGSFVSCAVGVRVGLRPAPFGVLGGRCALGCLVCFD